MYLVSKVRFLTLSALAGPLLGLQETMARYKSCSPLQNGRKIILANLGLSPVLLSFGWAGLSHPQSSIAPQGFVHSLSVSAWLSMGTEYSERSERPL